MIIGGVFTPAEAGGEILGHPAQPQPVAAHRKRLGLPASRSRARSSGRGSTRCGSRSATASTHRGHHHRQRRQSVPPPDPRQRDRFQRREIFRPQRLRRAPALLQGIWSTSSTIRGTTSFDFTGYPLSAADEALVTTRIGRLSRPINTDGGHMYGAEAAATLPFEIISDRSRASGSPAASPGPRPASRRPRPAIRRDPRLFEMGGQRHRLFRAGRLLGAAPASGTARPSSASCPASAATAPAGRRSARRSSMPRSATSSGRLQVRGPVPLPPGPEPHRRALRDPLQPRQPADRDRLSDLRPPLPRRLQLQILIRDVSRFGVRVHHCGGLFSHGRRAGVTGTIINRAP